MPELSRFYGIIIAIYYDEHNPPHFHARYNEYKVSIEINNFAILDGYIPHKAYGLVTEWALIHKEELLENWNLAKDGKVLKKINPL